MSIYHQLGGQFCALLKFVHTISEIDRETPSTRASCVPNSVATPTSKKMVRPSPPQTSARTAASSQINVPFAAAMPLGGNTVNAPKTKEQNCNCVQRPEKEESILFHIIPPCCETRAVFFGFLKHKPGGGHGFGSTTKRILQLWETRTHIYVFVPKI